MITRAYDLATRGRPKVEIPLSVKTESRSKPKVDWKWRNRNRTRVYTVYWRFVEQTGIFSRDLPLDS